MTQQEAKMRLADIWEHLNDSFQQWQFADDDGTRWLSSLLRDLDECRRVCKTLVEDLPVRYPARHAWDRFCN